jgi:hypothetical protein
MEVIELDQLEKLNITKVDAIHNVNGIPPNSTQKKDFLFIGTSENFLYSFTLEKQKHLESGQTNINFKSTKKQYLGKTKKITSIESDIQVGVLFVQHSLKKFKLKKHRRLDSHV